MRTGVWLVGARGSVAVTAIVGATALRAGLAEPTGCVTELPAAARPGPARLRRPGLRRPRHRHHPAGQEGRGAGRRRRRARPAGRRARATSWPRSRRSCGPLPVGDTQAGTAERIVRRPAAEFREPARPGPGGRGQRRPPPSRPPQPHPAHADLAALTAALRRAGRRCCRPARSYAYAAFTRRLPVRRLHAVDRGPAARPGRAGRAAGHCRTPGTTARPARRWSSRCSRPMFAMRNLRGPLLVRDQPARRRRRRQPRRPGRQRRQGRQQAAGARRDARLPAAGHHPHRVRRRPRRLQDRLGPDHLRRASSAPGCGWSSPGTAATRRWPRRSCSTWPGSPPPRTRAGRAGPLTELALLLQGPARRGPPTRWPSSGHGPGRVRGRRCAADGDR